MKTILVPIDFSNASFNAAGYAAEMAAQTNGRLILLHAYHAPLVASEVPVALPTLEEVEADTLAELAQLKTRLQSQFGAWLDIECLSVCGFAADVIGKIASEKGANLVVMGMRGAGLIEKLMGSVTTAIIARAKVPVLAIDEKIKFKHPKKIVLAADYKEINPSVLNPLKELAHIFKSHVYVLNVAAEMEKVPEVKEALAGVKLEHSLEDVHHSFHNTTDNDLIEGINRFIETNKMDLVVMVPREHSLLEKIFTGSNTKKMAFHTSIPLLTIHE